MKAQDALEFLGFGYIGDSDGFGESRCWLVMMGLSFFERMGF